MFAVNELCLYLPLERSVGRMSSLMLFQSFFAIEKLLAIFDVALEKHLVG